MIRLPSSSTLWFNESGTRSSLTEACVSTVLRLQQLLLLLLLLSLLLLSGWPSAMLVRSTFVFVSSAVGIGSF